MNKTSPKHALNATVRSLLLGFYKLKFAVGSRIAPRRTAATGAKLFCTPSRPDEKKLAPPPDFPRPAMREIVLPSGTVSVYEWGDPASQRTVLLIHGWNGWGMQFAHFIPALLEQGFAVVTLDHVAHGKSAGKHASLPVFIDTARELLQQMPTVSSVVAHSMGAAAIACVLVQERTAVLDVVLIAPPRGPRVFLEKFAAVLGIPLVLVDAMQAYIERHYGRTFAELSAETIAPGLQTRTLVIHDPSDQVVPFAHGECYARLAPRTTLASLVGWGHYKILRSPEAIQMTTSFLSHSTG